MNSPIIKFFFPAGFLLLFSCIAYGQERQEVPDAWTLQQCIQYASDHNYNLNTLRLSRESSGQTLLQSRAAQLPSVSANAAYSFNHTGTSFTGNGSTIPTTGSAGVNAGWTAYNGFYLRRDIEQKQLAVQIADLAIVNGENTVALQITQAYLQVLLDKENVVYRNDMVQTSTAQLKQTQDKYAVGSVARKDVVQLEAQLASDKYNLVTAINTEKVDRLALKQLLMLPADTTFDVVKPDTLFTLTLLPPLAEVQAEALYTRPEVKSAELSIQSYKLGLEKARAGYLPLVSLSAGVGANIGNSTTYNLGFSLNDQFYQQAGISLSMPLFSQRVNKTNVALARINIRQGKLDLDNTKITLLQTVEKAYVSAVNAQNQYTSAAEQLKYNQEALRISSEELRIGSANIVDYVQQRNLYVQALQQFLQAKYNAAMSLKIYEFYKGVPFTLE